jgi:hypothetical protein
MAITFIFSLIGVLLIAAGAAFLVDLAFYNDDEYIEDVIIHDDPYDQDERFANVGDPEE